MGKPRGQDMIARIAADLDRWSAATDLPDDASALLVEFDGPEG
jgi:hypothetical protein